VKTKMRWAGIAIFLAVGWTSIAVPNTMPNFACGCLLTVFGLVALEELILNKAMSLIVVVRPGPSRTLKWSFGVDRQGAHSRTSVRLLLDPFLS
jgi:hypothetical protein